MTAMGELDEMPFAPWFDEISFDPAAPLLQMGTRRLGLAHWLVVDDERGADLEQKSILLRERHGEVFAALPGSEHAGSCLLRMVEDELVGRGLAQQNAAVGSRLHSLDQAGRLVQEDLCLIQLRDGTWHLDAASLCFPSRWRLADKIGRPLIEVHGPVKNYDPVLVDRVNAVFRSLLNRDDDRPVWRRNWFIHPDPERFQPGRPVGGDPTVPASSALDKLWMRSERQILRKVRGCENNEQWAVFSIRIQQASLAELFVVPGRRDLVARYFEAASDSDIAHHGVSAAQRVELRSALG